MNEKKKIDIDICFSKAIMLNSISQQTLTQVSGVIWELNIQMTIWPQTLFLHSFLKQNFSMRLNFKIKSHSQPVLTVKC
jgi:hypothetical protein